MIQIFCIFDLGLVKARFFFYKRNKLKTIDMSKISYYTAEGLKKLKDELNNLKDVERPKASNLSLIHI